MQLYQKVDNALYSETSIFNQWKQMCFLIPCEKVTQVTAIKLRIIIIRENFI